MKSRVDARFEISEDNWVVSILNTGTTRLSLGHSILVVEGLDKKDKLFPELFVGQYDILAELDQNRDIEEKAIINGHRGKITEVRCFEGADYSAKIDYSTFPSFVCSVSPLNAKKMIASIKDDKKTTDQAKRGDRNYNYIKYQLSGENHFLSEEGAGINCTDWAVNKLAIAGIGKGAGKSKPKVQAGIKTGQERTSTASYCSIL